MAKIRKSSMISAVVFCLTLSTGSAFAQTCDPKDPKCEPPPEEKGDCSPGYYKNHIDYWWGIYCDATNGQCADLLTKLTCKGSDASCERSDAAAYLNGQSGCTE